MIDKAEKRILMVFTEWGTNEFRKKNNAYGGVGYYRIVKPAQELKKLGYDVTVMGKEIMDYGKTAVEMWSRLFIDYDIIIIKHIDDAQTASNLVAASRQFHKPVVIDMDDNLLEVPTANPAYNEYARGKEKRYYVQALIELADGLIVSTEPLKEQFSAINKSIDICPNFNDVEDWQFKPRRKHPKKTIIGYAGSITHNDDLALVVPALDRILTENRDVKLQILGAFYPQAFYDFVKQFKGAYQKQIEVAGGTPAWQGYPELLSQQNWDIGIAPLLDDVFNKGKSHIKWMEYAMYGIPTVASAVRPYSDNIVDGKTGFLAKDSDEFYQKLKLLVDNEQIGVEVGKNAREYVVRNLQYRDNIGCWVKVIEKYLDPSFTKPDIHAVQ